VREFLAYIYTYFDERVGGDDRTCIIVERSIVRFASLRFLQ